MGLFDGIFNDPNQMGLLAAAASMMQNSGPSRTPVGLGQILGGGLMDGMGAYQGAKKQQARNEYDALQLRTLRGQMEQQEAARAEEAAIRKAAQSAFQTPEQQAASLPGGPTMANAAQIPNMPGGFNQDAFLNRVMEIDPLRGMELRQKFSKQAPKFDTKVNVAVDEQGTPFQYILDEAGNMKRLDGALPRDKLEFRDVGDSTVALDQFNGKLVSRLKNGVAPSALLSANVQMRGQNMSDARAREGLALQREQLQYKPAPEGFNKSSTGLLELQNTVKNYRQVIKELGGTRVMPNSDNAHKLRAAFTGVQMGLKNAMELGALAGPDVEILGGMLMDPTSAKGFMAGTGGIEKQVEQVEKYLGGRKAAIEKTYGRAVKTEPLAAADGWAIQRVD